MSVTRSTRPGAEIVRQLAARPASPGFTLVEVLIALLVVTIGLLGMAGLQAYSLKNNISAYHRSQANNRIYEILDLMRANRPAALAGAYDIDFDDPAPDGASRAEIDVAHWRNALRAGEDEDGELSNPAGLPSGNGSIDCTTNAPVCTIVVEWDDTRGSAEGSLQRQQIAISTQI